MITDLALPSVVALAAGLVGGFAVMRRMSLAGDALSHVALPGIGIAIALHVSPMFGAVTMLGFGALLVWALEDQTRLATETIIGVVFSTALALGSLLTSGDDLLDALLGRGAPAGPGEATFAFIAATAIVVWIVRDRHRLVIALISPDLARTAGINPRRLNLAFLLAFAVTVALGLRYLGVLLMGSLIIIPAATAKRLSSRLTTMLALSAGIAVVATDAGTWAAARWHRESGPMIVLIAAGAFVVAAITPKR